MMGDKSVKLTDRTKSLTFIFHDPTNSNASTNKAAINSYIAKSTHDRRKQAKVLQHCRHDADMHTAICRRPWKHREDACKADALGRNFGQLNVDVLSRPPLASITVRMTRKSATTAHNRATNDCIRPPNPLNILLKGNSDPFNVYAIPITPCVNVLLSYSRDYYIPATTDPLNPLSSGNHRSRQWAGYVNLLQDECTASAYLCQIVAAMPPNVFQHQAALKIESLSFKVKSVQLLRQRLVTSVNDPATVRAMELLMTAATDSRDFIAAKHHATMLAQLLQAADAPADPVLLFETFSKDSHRAVMSLTRPSFDVDGWIADTFAPLFKPLIDSLPEIVKVEAVAGGLDPSLDNLVPRSAIINARHILAIFLLCSRDRTYATPQLFHYMRYGLAVSNNKLINCYADSLEKFEGDLYRPWQSLPSDISRVRLWARIEAIISLAGIIWARTVARIDDITVYPGVPLWSTNDMLLARTKELLVEIEENLSEAAQAEYARIKLWTLYVGAYAEHAQAKRTGTEGKTTDQWYSIKLAEQATAMRLITRDAVRDVLLGFLYIDVLESLSLPGFPSRY